MRFVVRTCIQPGSVLAKPILGTNGEVLLNEGVEMKPAYIRSMEKLGILGAYIDDPLSRGLEVVNAISDELKAKAVKSISTTFSKVVKKDKSMEESGENIRMLAEQILEEILSHGDVMLNMFDLKTYNSYTFYHCVNVASLAIVIGTGLGFTRTRLINLAYAALMHDIGKMLIDQEIIEKPGALTRMEYEIVKRHPEDGYAYVKEHFTKSVTEEAARGILEHHERLSGEGYPEQKKEKDITTVAKVLAIADVYDALVSDRAYRKGIFPVEAMQYIQGNCGTHFDLGMVQAFTRKVALFPVGTSVLLSNGATALVMENYEGMTERPLVKVFLENNREVEPYWIDLSRESLDVTVVASVFA